MVLKCRIDFDDNRHGTFYAGQTVTGRIILLTDEQMTVRAVALKVRGFANTCWTETKNGPDNKSETITYQGREIYIASKTYMLGSSDGTENISLKIGIHKFNFAWQLPLSCPSSFEGMYGHVRYKVQLILERPWSSGQMYTRYFTVLKMMDLNDQSRLLALPVHTEVEKTFCCWPCGSKPMTFKLSLPKTGFASGEEIPVGLLVTNDSSVLVEEIKITLAMRVRYYCQNSSTASVTQRLVMAKMVGEGVMRQSTKSFVYPLRVPATPSTYFSLSRILQIAYQIELEAKIKGWHRNEFATIPVTIGSVPLVESPVLVQHQPMSNRSELLMLPTVPLDDSSIAQLTVVEVEPSAPDNFDDGSQLSLSNNWIVDDLMPPPNYEEAMQLSYSQNEVRY